MGNKIKASKAAKILKSINRLNSKDNSLQGELKKLKKKESSTLRKIEKALKNKNDKQKTGYDLYMEKQLPKALLTKMINRNKELKQILNNIPKGGPLREKIQEWATDID